MILFCFAAVSEAATDKEAYLHFMNGMTLERKGNYDSALQEYRRTMLLDPQSVFVYKQALNLALHIGKIEEAGQWAEFVVRTDSATADNWVLYGNVKWARGDLEGARTAYEKGAELDPSAYEAFYQLASLWSSRNPEKAIGYLKQYMALRTEDAAEVYYQIAVLHNAMGNADGVRENLLKSRESDSFYPQPRYMLANFYEMKNDTAAALAEYSELIALEPQNIELFNRVGELYSGPLLNNPGEAEKYFLKAWALDKKDPTACFWLSVINEQKRDFNAAAAYLENSGGLKNDAGLALRLAYYYTQSGRYERAIALLELASKKWPDNTEVAYFLALGYDDTGKTDKARGMLKAILNKDPDNSETRMQYAVISERENDMAVAEENFRYLLVKNPNNANVMNYLGYSLADRGLKLEEAELLIAGAIALEQGNGAYLDSLAWVRFKRGNLPGAQEGIKRAVKAVYDDAVIWAHAGEIYAAAGDSGVAWLAWKNSWLLEKPAKRARAAVRLKELQKKIAPAVLSALEAAYLRNFSPAGMEFASFARVEAKLRGKTVKFDAMLHFSPPSDFSLTVMGPLMVPLWKAKISGGVMDMDAIEIKDIDSGTFSYWASLVAGELNGWFTGDYLADAPGGDWREPCFTGVSREVCLDSALSWPEEITNKAESKLTFRPGNYFLKNLYLFPETMDFKLPFVSLRLTLDKNQMNFSGANTLKLPE